MAKKMGVRGRPGLLFVGILIIFLAVFFLTWKSMISPKRNSPVKDVYSMNYQPSKLSNSLDNPPHSDFNHIWQHAKFPHKENTGNEQGKEKERNDDYDLSSDKQIPDFPGGTVEKKSPLSDLLHATHKPVVKDVETEPYYMKPNESLKIIGGRMERFVHLDLKGAAPKVSYLKEVFPLLSRLGATGLLIEYEDMFPYSGKLEVISAENSYTKEQIKEILSLAEVNSLQVIPLIQTFGHMEFVLKPLQMKSLRESSHTPQVINVASNVSYGLIREMVSQILAAHPTARYLHVGCDEVYELGRGSSSDIIIKEKLTTEALFLRHVKRVADIVAKTSEKKVRPIIWDDELRKISDEDIMASGLPSSVDIMVWRYTQNISDKLNETIWKKYGRLFKTVWAASSFKGATGARQVYTEPQHHIINHFSWMDAVSKYSHLVSFKGIALTGWQRFDHFATLCELFPVAIPSLAVCLATIRNGGFDKSIHKTTSSLLGCSGMIEMGFPKLDKTDRRALVSQDCRFPGHMVYYAVQELWGYKQFEEEGRRTGWLSDYQVRRGFSNPGQLKVLSMRLFSLRSNFVHVREPLEENLLQIYTKDTVEEWLDENIFEEDRLIKGVQEKVQSMMKKTHWARRPNLPVITEAPVITPSGQETNIDDTAKRDSMAGISRASGHKIPSAVHKSDVHLREQKLEDQKRMLERVGAHPSHLNHDENVASFKTVFQNQQNSQQKINKPVIQRIDSNKVAKVADSKEQANSNPIFRDMTKNRLGTGDDLKGKDNLFRKNSIMDLSKHDLRDTSKEKHIPDNHMQDASGLIKRMSSNQQAQNTENNEGTFVENSGKQIAQSKEYQKSLEKELNLNQKLAVGPPAADGSREILRSALNTDVGLDKSATSNGGKERIENEKILAGMLDKLGNGENDNLDKIHENLMNEFKQGHERGL